LDNAQIVDLPENAGEEQTNWGKFIRDILETLVLAIVLFVGINAVSARVRVDGFSMRPTLQDGEFVLVNRLAYRFGGVQRGDIIVFRYPSDTSQELIKRVIGLPGEHVEIRSGQVFINEQPMNEAYIAAQPVYSGTWQIPENQLFVLGDNRNDSSDSHSWGLLPITNVIGKAILIYWPPPYWTVIKHVSALVH
jgi:signal peptidase I